MLKSNRIRDGFTIVELLVVIVVIGILAATSYVVYSGVQKRAYNVQTLSTVKAYITGLNVYSIEKNTYPSVPGSVCLGAGYTDVNGDGAGDCGDIGSGEMVRENAAFNQQLLSVMSSLPSAVNTRTKATFSGNPWVGATLTRWDDFMVDGKRSPYFVKYVLEGSNENCGLRAVSVRTGSSYPDMVSNGAVNTWWDAQSTTCVVPLEG